MNGRRERHPAVMPKPDWVRTGIRAGLGIRGRAKEGQSGPSLGCNCEWFHECAVMSVFGVGIGFWMWKAGGDVLAIAPTETLSP